jgi:hypothetical protein
MIMDNLISYEYVKVDIILTELKEILKSKDSQSLNHKPLFYYLKNVVFLNDIVVNNLINNDEIFKYIYEKHIIKGEKIFELMEDTIGSMALSWLMYLYH